MFRNSPLGQDSNYPETYSPGLLFGIARADSRTPLGLTDALPFRGMDIWNAWELTWLTESGQPRVATAEIRVPVDSPRIIESKSLKLYLNSFSMSRFASVAELSATIARDLGDCVGTDIELVLAEPPAAEAQTVGRLPGDCIDVLNVECDDFAVNAALLTSDSGDIVTESLYSHLLRSLCPVTNQPDSGSLLVDYKGPRIERAGLLRYIVSFRQHNDFHEACVERMFLDLQERCSPVELTVYARYQRRGGIDINPFRSNKGSAVRNLRLWRQ